MISHPRIAIYDLPWMNPLILDSSIEFMTFPGGEPHVKLSPAAAAQIRREDAVLIDCRPQSFLDLGYLMLLADTIRRIAPFTELHLLMPYVPGARQDRGEPFTALVFADLINNLWFETIRIYDPHSPVIVEYLEGVVVSEPDLHPYMHGSYAAVIAPDEGSKVRATRMAIRVGLTENDVVYCSKKRDPVNGTLSGFALDTFDLPRGRYLLFDDICDGGGTFLGVYDTIAERYAELYNALPEIDLFVTHGIFSKGTHDLLLKFNRIYSTTSWRSYHELYDLIVTPIRIHEQEKLS